MNWYNKTIETYDRSAQELAEYFKGIGPRIEDIDHALELAGNPENARVIEIGCGDGRDAVEIRQRVSWYEGFDPSEGLLDLASQKAPDAQFVKADALTYEYPSDIDVVFAFASLLHVAKTDMPTVFRKIEHSLRPGGIAYVSLKRHDEYLEDVKIDTYGERMFYYYNASILKDLAGVAFSSVFEQEYTIGNTDWFTLALMKK